MDETSGFKDHFSRQAADYAAFRPRYPDALFDFLADHAPARDRVWDCATGNGQAAVALGARFDRVIATDASAAQLEQAESCANVEYRCAPAEASGLEDASVSLVTVGQALHWFRFDDFWAEVRRVLVPGGIVAVWCYELFTVDPELDAIIDRFYRGAVAPYWPPERAHIENGYRDIPFPFAEVETPTFAMTARWSLAQVMGYFRSWSATARFIAANGSDPTPELERELAPGWQEPLEIRWPLTVRVGRL